jgi:hypothetical protein
MMGAGSWPSRHQLPRAGWTPGQRGQETPPQRIISPSQQAADLNPPPIGWQGGAQGGRISPRPNSNPPPHTTWVAGGVAHLSYPSYLLHWRRPCASYTLAPTPIPTLPLPLTPTSMETAV